MKARHYMIILVILVANFLFIRWYINTQVIQVILPLKGLESSQFPADNPPPQIIISKRDNDITRAVKAISPAVVSINVIKTKIVRRHTNPFQNPFFGFLDNMPVRRSVKSIGSGIIFTPEGHIITNSHVVEGATEITVVLADGSSYDAMLSELDQIQDLAILQIKGENLPLAKFGKSSDLIIGEWCVAVGNPYKYLLADAKPSVSVGVISALDRNFGQDENGKVYQKMIQTDAAINPGNSGGPLVNIYGEVIGINTFILSESGGSVGIAFAIPIDRVKKLANEILEYGRIRDVWFGFKAQNITAQIAYSLQLKNLNGIIVTTLDAGGPGETSGLGRGDIIISINKSEINSLDDARNALIDVGVGDIVPLKIIRNSKKMNLNLTVQEFKASR